MSYTVGMPPVGGSIRTPRQPRAPAPSPLSTLPLGFFREPRGGSSAPPPAMEEVPAWLFVCGDITEDQAAHIAAAIDGVCSTLFPCDRFLIGGHA